MARSHEEATESDGGSVQTLPSGFPTLDTRIGGGFPTGSLLTVSAPTTSPGEMVCENAVRESDTTSLYLSTTLPAQAIEPRLEKTGSMLDMSESNDQTLVERISAQQVGDELPPLPADIPDHLALGLEGTRSHNDEALDLIPDAPDGIPIPTAETPLASAIRYVLTASNPTIAIDAISDLLDVGEPKRSSDAERTGGDTVLADERAWARLVDWLYLIVHATDGVALGLVQRDSDEPLGRAAKQFYRVASGHLVYRADTETDRLEVTQMQGLNKRSADIDSLPISLNLEFLDQLSADPTKRK
jgi:hypothetical protein